MVFLQQAERAGAVTWDPRRRNLTRILDTWITQQNYPVVMVTARPADATLTVTQRRFLSDADDDVDANSGANSTTGSHESPFGSVAFSHVEIPPVGPPGV